MIFIEIRMCPYREETQILLMMLAIPFLTEKRNRSIKQINSSDKTSHLMNGNRFSLRTQDLSI